MRALLPCARQPVEAGWGLRLIGSGGLPHPASSAKPPLCSADARLNDGLWRFLRFAPGLRLTDDAGWVEGPPYPFGERCRALPLLCIRLTISGIDGL